MQSCIDYNTTVQNKTSPSQYVACSEGRRITGFTRRYLPVAVFWPASPTPISPAVSSRPADEASRSSRPKHAAPPTSSDEASLYSHLLHAVLPASSDEASLSSRPPHSAPPPAPAASHLSSQSPMQFHHPQ